MKKFDKALDDLLKQAKWQLITGCYSFIEADEFTATVAMGEDLKVEIWTANDPLLSLSIYKIHFKSLKISEECGYLFLFENYNERKKAWEELSPHVDLYRKAQLQKQLLTLQNQLK